MSKAPLNLGPDRWGAYPAFLFLGSRNAKGDRECPRQKQKKCFVRLDRMRSQKTLIAIN
jgi:hypothetical protein